MIGRVSHPKISDPEGSFLPQGKLPPPPTPSLYSPSYPLRKLAFPESGVHGIVIAAVRKGGIHRYAHRVGRVGSRPPLAVDLAVNNLPHYVQSRC